ncbi:MAG: hypothetical protein LRY46_02880 [Candidatus Pacebacteria bacterium]|nr:hypothetical protein [Candidatus Paceibacterota bacterium]
MNMKKYVPISVALGILILLVLTMSFTSISPYQTSTALANALTTAQNDEAALRRRLAELEREIAEQQQKLNAQRGQSSSIQGEIDKLKNEINKTRLDIQRKNTVIQQLSGQINQKESKIQELDAKLTREQASLGQIIRKMNELDKVTLIEVMLSQQTLSDFFSDKDSFESIKFGLSESYSNIQNITQLTLAERRELERKRVEEADTKASLEEERRRVERQEAEQRNLLNVSRTNEKTFEKLFANAKRKPLKFVTDSLNWPEEAHQVKGFLLVTLWYLQPKRSKKQACVPL